MLKNVWTTLVVFVLASNCASAQLIIGVDILSTLNPPDGFPQALNINLDDTSSEVLWSGALEVWGMTYDRVSDQIFVVSGRELHVASSDGETLTKLGEIFIPSESVFFVPQGLACANGELYASRMAIEVINVTAVTGIIDPDSLEVDPVFPYDPDRYGFAGLAFNEDDGLFYATQNDPTTTEPLGLYSIDIFGNGDINFIAPYPAGRFDIDGLTVGDGIAYLVEEVAGDTIHPFDLAGNAYLPSILRPLQHPTVPLSLVPLSSLLKPPYSAM